MQNERNIITTMNALFCIIILLPIIPTSMAEHLQELFQIFLHLSNWKANNDPKLTQGQAIHLQFAISTLFQRLYGMYPCNFISFLRDHIKEKNTVYREVIKPLFDTIKLHPMLLTSTRESEKNNSRWKEMEPHDVVVECSKFSLENPIKLQGCEHEYIDNTWYTQLIPDTPSNLQFRNTFAPILEGKQRVKNSQKFDCIWSPSIAVLATPPPTNTQTHTPTPTMINPNYTIQTISSGPYNSSGASPPEAAVEATPETTPMKDVVRPHRTYPVNSSAVRTIWLNNSQPSSPLKKDDGASFRYPENAASSIMSSTKFSKMVNDRNLSKALHDKLGVDEENSNNMFDIEIQDPLSITANEQDSTQEDEEVTEINKCKIEEKSDDPLSFGNDGTKIHLDAPREFRSRCNLLKSHQMNKIGEENVDEYEETVSPRRFSSSWPGLKLYIKPLDNRPTDVNDKELGQIKEVNSCTIGTQTVEEIVPLYEQIAKELLTEELNQRKLSGNNLTGTLSMSPHTLLDQYIETAIKKQSSNDGQAHTYELELLNLQLQYERYRREVHAERNRRLLGKSRDNAALKMDNQKLNYQVEKISKDLITMTENLNKAKLSQNTKEQDFVAECGRLRGDIQKERDTNKNVQLELELLKRRLNEEIEEKKKLASSLEATQAEVFDLKNHLRHYQEQTDIGNKNKEELQRLQSKEVVMGEIQMKLREKLIELNNLRARDGEIALMKHSHMEEVKGE